MRLDVYNDKSRFESWKQEAKEGIMGISKSNSKLLFTYVNDMELGQNIARGSRKGARSYSRLNCIRIRLMFVMKALEERGIKDITKAKEKQVHTLFDDMSKGNLKRKDGKQYTSVADYVKTLKSFWHWYQKISKKQGKEVEDITTELDTSKEEPGFVYITKEELEQMMPYFSKDEQVRMLFMFDTIIRSPTELMNVKVSDLSSDCKELAIRDETSKTFGRRIKILLCADELKKYIERNELKEEDYLFKFSKTMFNDKLQLVAKKLFGEKITKGGSPYSSLTMYDFRHSGAIYWRLGAYRSKIDALMYRGGWNNLEILNYYTKKIGMKDSIEKEDMLIGVDKNEMEKQIEKIKSEFKAYVKETDKVLRKALEFMNQ